MNKYEDVSLKPYNTFGIDAQCKRLYKIQSIEHLQTVLQRNERPFYILGGGSNLLISRDQKATFLKNEISGIEICEETDEKVVLKVGGGVNWHELVLWTLGQEYGGLENLSLIPGTVGASPIQNIGAYGVELENVFQSLEAVELATGEVVTFEKKDCEFGYRDSIFKRELKGKFFISYVSFVLTKRHHVINISYAPLAARFSDAPTIQEVSKAVIEIRQSKLPDPAKLGNSGSFFKNPIVPIALFESIRANFAEVPSYPIDDQHVKLPAGWLIEKAGWKGKRIGDAGSYEKQALVLVNHGTATGPEIWKFAQMIIGDVERKFGVELQPEVNII